MRQWTWLAVLGCCGFGSPAGGQPAPSGQTCLIADYSGGKLCFFADGKGIVWSYPIQGVYDAWVLKDGHVLAATRTFVAEIEPDVAKGSGGKVCWEYKAPADEAKGEFFGCQPLPGDRVVSAKSGACRILELDRQGKPVKSIPFAVQEKNAHLQVRNVRKTPAGTYLLACLAEGLVREVDGDGKVVRTLDVKAGRQVKLGVYEALPLPDGGILAGAGDLHAAIEYDREGKIVWQAGEGDIPDVKLGFVSGVDRLPDGSTMICNWAGGTPGLRAVRVTRDKKPIWILKDPAVKGPVRVQVLTADYKPLEGK
jgi:hypothetical protein